jgi:transcriptional regulator with XRE-family HTH domain
MVELDGLDARLKRVRIAMGLSRRSFSLTAGLSAPVVGQIERREADPKRDTLGKLASRADVPVEWLGYGVLSKSVRASLNARAAALGVRVEWLIDGEGPRARAPEALAA